VKIGFTYFLQLAAVCLMATAVVLAWSALKSHDWKVVTVDCLLFFVNLAVFMAQFCFRARYW
jgi:hypothetical protein